MQRNVLVVLTDDHGQWAAGCYGNSEVRTPTLDHLAGTGVRMANAFTPTPVCSPARASFWTGRLPSQHGVHDYLAGRDPEVAATPWLQDETTLAALLHDQGYVTGLSGKWHLGPVGELPPAGFDFWYERSGPVPRPLPCFAPWPTEPERETPGYDRHAMTDRAVEFLRRRDGERPFFLTVGYFATHSPWLGHAERLVDSYRGCHFDDIPDDITYPFGRLRSEAVYGTRANPREALAQYYAAVTDVDEQVGRLLDELEAQGLRESTLVVYTADHGLNAGHHGLWGKGNATIPYNMLEESIRVPLILNQPGTLLGGQVRQEPVTHLDTFATIAEHAGVPLPADRRYPGRSFRDLAVGKAIPGWPDAVHGEYGTTRMIRTPQHKLVRRHPSGPHELFDLAADPRETTNLHACPEHQELVKKLTEDLDRYFEEYTDPRFSGLRAAELPRHNGDEAWREPGAHVVVDEPAWLANL
ncbi:sulfatase-like hydrolase/transferase [Amycolatopsis jejuensis]|uniref:sulfatase-like hydrolase/transferase n=1 Tax=Amycolatopsis jejuensis TaxID=330084 RepID=UPI00068C93F7|nr:sulfatase-like hydrolase/transferase [Amycolatopsis jejuensis]